MGYRYSVADYDAYRFAWWFYYCISYGYTIQAAKQYAEDVITSVKGNIQLYGDGTIRLVD